MRADRHIDLVSHETRQIYLRRHALQTVQLILLEEGFHMTKGAVRDRDGMIFLGVPVMGQWKFVTR